LAKGIEDYRNANGPFKSRKELHNVPKLGPKAFEQCAGFLRIADGYPLDNTSVHPESYPIALSFLKEEGLALEDLGKANTSAKLASIDRYRRFSHEIRRGQRNASRHH
jgi:uncharacterized protein